MSLNRVAPVLAAALLGAALAFSIAPAKADPPGTSQCLPLPMAGPTSASMEKGATKVGEAIDQLHAAGKTNIVAVGPYVCGW
jgi:hypothetical protein